MRNALGVSRVVVAAVLGLCLLPAARPIRAQDAGAPDARVRRYLHFLDDRIDAIRSLTPQAPTQAGELRARFEEYTRISDELSESIDNADAAGADLRKPLKSIADNSPKWTTALQAPPANPTYDDSRSAALAAAASLATHAAKVAAAEDVRSSKH